MPWRRIVRLLGAALDVAIFFLYLAIVHSQQGDNGIAIALIATFIGLLAVLSIYAAVAARGKTSRVMFLIAGALNFGVGVLALASIGFLFIIAGALLLSGGATRGSRTLSPRPASSSRSFRSE